MDEIQEYLLDPDCHPPSDIEVYLRGQCDVFAIAVNELTKLDICIITEPRQIANEAQNGYYVAECLVHAFCLHPEESGKIFDAKGWRKSTELQNEYPLHSKCSVKIVSKDELIQFVYRDQEFDQVRLHETIHFVMRYYNIYRDKVTNNG